MKMNCSGDSFRKIYNGIIFRDSGVFSKITEKEMRESFLETYSMYCLGNSSPFLKKEINDYVFVFDLNDVSQRMVAADILYQYLCRRISRYCFRNNDGIIEFCKNQRTFAGWDIFCSDIVSSLDKLIFSEDDFHGGKSVMTPFLFDEMISGEEFSSVKNSNDEFSEIRNRYFSRWESMGMVTEGDVLMDLKSRFAVFFLRNRISFPENYDIVGNMFGYFIEKNMIEEKYNISDMKKAVCGYHIGSDRIVFL